MKVLISDKKSEDFFVASNLNNFYIFTLTKAMKIPFSAFDYLLNFSEKNSNSKDHGTFSFTQIFFMYSV